MHLADLIRFTHEVMAKAKEKTDTLTSCTPLLCWAGFKYLGRTFCSKEKQEVLYRSKCFRSDFYSKERGYYQIPSGISSSFMKANAIIIFIKPICTESTADILTTISVK